MFDFSTQISTLIFGAGVVLAFIAGGIVLAPPIADFREHRRN